MNSKAKYVRLLESNELNLLYRNLARGSKVTADVYLRRLGFFCEKHGIMPEELAKLSDEEDLRLEFRRQLLLVVGYSEGESRLLRVG